MEDFDTGLLLNKHNITLHRQYFEQMVKLLGIKAGYRVPIDATKTYNGYGELDTYYHGKEIIGCIYDEHPTQKSMRKFGWNSELSDQSVVIHVPYNLHDLQAGCIFELPAGVDGGQPRWFKIIRMSNISVYPVSIACELGPLYQTTTEEETVREFKQSNFNLLNDESDKYGY